mmetsp:Transcript_72020/g.141278  ORF Transcript_72020/g.141278 Transcript_72020/m.141278 type:complete len:130 (-) Transcript_72020:552-941(-)
MRSTCLNQQCSLTFSLSFCFCASLFLLLFVCLFCVCVFVCLFNRCGDLTNVTAQSKQQSQPRVKPTSHNAQLQPNSFNNHAYDNPPTSSTDIIIASVPTTYSDFRVFKPMSTARYASSRFTYPHCPLRK